MGRARVMYLLPGISVCLALWLSPASAQPVQSINLIPAPLQLRAGSGAFVLNGSTRITLCEGAGDAAELLRGKLKDAAGIGIGTVSGPGRSVIEFRPAAAVDSLGDEGYLLDVTDDSILIRASQREGFFYAVQTILQLLSPEIVRPQKSDRTSWSIPAVTIRDLPKYRWRSFMLDSGRQFQTVEFVKRYLDVLAQLKINVFHWHLTEGQGWRIEIKKYPRLTEIGSRVATGEEQQGYYSQEDIRQVVAYARQRCITVVPEIDLPGHSEAALRAYPEFSCSGQAPQTVMEFTPHLFCGGSEATYNFIQDVLTEVCDLFPGNYIHLGGDEAPKDVWDTCAVCKARIVQEGLKNSHELQIYFSTRVAAMLKRHGKKCILWGDVLEQSGPRLPENVVIYWWNYRKKRDAAFAEAIRMGYPVICGTNYYTYLNFPVTPWSHYLADRTFDARQAYELNPSDMEHPSPLVLGMGACLWTDWYVKMRMIDQRVFPRLLVLAEQMWSKGKKPPFEEYLLRMRRFYPRLEAQGIEYGPALKEDVPEGYRWE
jgi:hexosaminidase